MRISDWSSDVCSSDLRMPSYGADVILGLLQACRAAEHHLVIESVSAGDADEAQAILERFLDLVTLDGIVLVPPLCDTDWVLDVLESRNLPFARINPGLQLGRGLCLVIDNRNAARQVGEAILSLGHRRIGLIDGPEAHAARTERKTRSEEHTSELQSIMRISY